MKNKLKYLIAAFLGYLIGRLSHVYFGHLNGMHHWIIGLLIVLFGFFNIKKDKLAKLMVAFGMGLFISDLTDFINMKTFEPDVGTPVLWGFD